MGYLTNFIVYTLAMVGVIVLALFIFKSSTTAGVKASSKYLEKEKTTPKEKIKLWTLNKNTTI